MRRVRSDPFASIAALAQSEPEESPQSASPQLATPQPVAFQSGWRPGQLESPAHRNLVNKEHFETVHTDLQNAIAQVSSRVNTTENEPAMRGVDRPQSDVKSAIPFFVAGMLVTGISNSLFNKYQDMQCVAQCDDPDPARHVDFSQPVSPNVVKQVQDAIDKVIRTVIIWLG